MSDTVEALSRLGRAYVTMSETRRADAYVDLVPRKLRIEVKDGIYHVNSKGSNNGAIAFDGADFDAFVAMLARVALKYRWVVYAYCVLPNHFHILLRIPYLGLSRGMQELNGGYSRRMSLRYGRIAHLFRNRFFDTFVEDEPHFLWACRYVVRNAPDAGLCPQPEDWPWSSYRATAGLEVAPSFLAVRETLEHFGDRPDVAMTNYREFVRNGDDPVSDTGTEV